jgi:beta-glucanase (GH16 family)
MKRTAAIVILLALPHMTVAAEPYCLSFDTAVGGLPKGWVAAKTGQGLGSEWAVVEDATAPGGKALAQTSDKGPRPLFNLCIAEETSFQDVDLTVSFKAVGGKIDQGGGPVWRYQDANNYYIARMNPLEDNYRVYKVVDGKRTQLGSADVKVPAVEWHRIRVVHKGDKIQCFLDGKLHLEVTDDTFRAGGKVGLWTKADAQTRFAGLRVTSAAEPQKNADLLPPAPAGQTWKLVWQDEFDGNKLDESKWDVPDHKRRDGWWSPKAVSLDGDGNLAISTLKDGDRYLDACVRTRGKFEHAHGYYVARIKLQNQPGHWSAFWLYNSSVGKIGDEGRDGTEIDIMEKPWRDDRVQHALHWDGYGKEHRSEGHVAKVPGVMDGWHTFSLWWKADEYVFYVDGKETWRTKAGGVCQVPLYIKLSDEIGDWGGDITKAKLPDKFLVDYVRVYDLVDAKSIRP